jgi:hypothetical protein
VGALEKARMKQIFGLICDSLNRRPNIGGFRQPSREPTETRGATASAGGAMARHDEVTGCHRAGQRYKEAVVEIAQTRALLLA